MWENKLFLRWPNQSGRPKVTLSGTQSKDLGLEYPRGWELFFTEVDIINLLWHFLVNSYDKNGEICSKNRIFVQIQSTDQTFAILLVLEKLDLPIPNQRFCNTLIIAGRKSSCCCWSKLNRFHRFGGEKFFFKKSSWAFFFFYYKSWIVFDSIKSTLHDVSGQQLVKWWKNRN